jgi:transposase InsO family protein
MPFKERSIMEDREEFCRLACGPGGNVRELCRRWSLSSATAYKWLQRYEEAGRAGLVDRPRRPLRSPWRTAEALEARVLAVRLEHPAWGGRKIRRVLQNEGVARPPSASTITQIVRRHGLLDGPRAGQARDWTRFEHAEPNDLWQMDFKGHVALSQGRCHPLTVLDDHSRYCLELGACGDEQTLTVRRRLERVFARHGLPRRILTDNGSPWGTAGSSQRHTPLTVWLLDLEVGVSHGRPYHPQTQGKEERFHRTLKGEVLGDRTFDSLEEAQKAFDAWRPIYNAKRPHEGIGMATPASRYRMSPRKMPETIAPAEYEPGVQTRKVDPGGWLSFKGRDVNCPKAFAGRRLALRATAEDGVFDLCYRRHVLSQVDLRENIVKTVHDVPERPFTLNPV